MSETDARDVLIQLVQEAATRAGVALPLDPDADLISLGVFDSIGFVMMLAEVEERTGTELALEERDPAEYVQLNGLLALVTANDAP